MKKFKEKLGKLKKSKSASSNDEAVRKIEDYYKMTSVFLGAGAFASVRRAKNKETGELVAVKIQEKDEQVDEAKMFEEVKLQKKFAHPQVVRVYDVFETKEHLYIVQELMQGGELFDIIADAKEISEAQASQVMREILLGVKHLHGRGVAHRDIKPENILCMSKKWPLHVKIADFGFATAINREGETENDDFVGSPDYVAPEIARNEPHGTEVDMWSCGVILYILLSGIMPFGGEGVEMGEKLCNVGDGKFEFPEMYWGNISTAAISLVQGLMQLDPNKRLTADAALLHEFIDKPELLKRTSTGNDMSGIHSRKLKKVVVGIITTNKLQMLLKK